MPIEDRGRRAAAAGLALALAAAPAFADHHMRWRWSGDVGAGYDDNLGNAAWDGDARDSALVGAGVNLDHVRSLSLDTSLLLRGALQGEWVERHDGLSHGRLLGMARLAHRAPGGFHMPTLAAWASVAALEYGSALRDGTELRAGAWAMAPLTTAVSARLELGAAERRGAGAVFDLSGWSTGVSLDWRVAPRLTAYAAYRFLDGDIVSSGSVPYKAHGGEGEGGIVAEDDDALDGLVAYRLGARTHLATLGVNVPLSSRLALDGQLRRADASAAGAGYERWQGFLGLLWRW